MWLLKMGSQAQNWLWNYLRNKLLCLEQWEEKNRHTNEIRIGKAARGWKAIKPYRSVALLLYHILRSYPLWFQILYLCYVGWNQWLMNPYFTDVYWIHGVTTKNHWYDSWFFPMFSVRPDVLSLKYWTWASAFSPHFNSVTIWNIQSCSTYTCGDY